MYMSINANPTERGANQVNTYTWTSRHLTTASASALTIYSLLALTVSRDGTVYALQPPLCNEPVVACFHAA